MFDGEAFGREVVEAVKLHIAAAEERLVRRLEALEARPVPTAPISVRSAVIDRSGVLILQLSDGTTQAVGEVAGKDGKNGEDGKSFSAEEARSLIAEQIGKAVAGIPIPKDGRDGRDVDECAVKDEIARCVKEAVAEIPLAKDGIDGRDGKDADPESVRELLSAEFEGRIASTVAELVDKAVAQAALKEPDHAAIAAAVAGVAKSVRADIPTRGDVEALVAASVTERVAEAVAALPVPKDGDPGRDGRDADPQEIARLLIPEVERAVSEMPPPKDGTDGTSVRVDDVKPLIAGLVDAAVKALPAPKDGLGVAGAMIDRDGNLVLTLSDGTTKEMGRVVGRDGADVDPQTVRGLVEDAVASLPRPKDGEDGIGFDDMAVAETDAGFFLRFMRGDRVKEFRIPVVRDRGVYELGRVYGKGDGVSYGGSFFIAQEDGVTERPGTGKGWRLAVKRGRDRTDPVKIGGKNRDGDGDGD